MTDATDEVAGTTVPDANASQTNDAPADAERDESGSEAGSSPAAADAGDSSQKAIKDLQQRVNKTTKNWRETERERDYWREQALRSQQTPAPQPNAAPADEAIEPLKTEADFDYDPAKYAQYLQDRIDRIAEAKAERAVEKRLQAERERAESAKREGDFNARIEAFRKDAPDFDEVVNDPTLNISTAMAEVIRRHELGPAMAYHLGKHPDVAEQIAKLPPADAAFELGLVAAQVRAARAPAPPPAPVVTKAPPPPPKLDASDSTPPVRTTDPSGDSLSDDEWVRLERKRLSRKR